jgi:uncharacterized protein YndB with AHSA1/START domain
MTSSANLKFAAQGERELVVTRVFDAPRHLVFEAWSKPELVRRWLTGPPGWTMPVCEIDLSVGGAYRFLWRKADGSLMGMGGVYLEVKAPKRTVATEKFDEAWYPGEALVTNTLAERGGRTTSTLTVLYPTREGRDTALNSGMENGMAAGYARLDALLASML